MSSLIWYVYDFVRKAWIDGFANARSKPEITDKPLRFRDFPKVLKEYCIGCGACISSCPSPNAIKLVKDAADEESEGLTYPVINKSSCIRCGFCAEVCPSEPKTLECGENHLIMPEFNIIPSSRQYVVDDFLCIRCKKCIKACPVEAISVIGDRMVVNQLKCIACGDCVDVCKVNGAMKALYVDNIEQQKKLIAYVVDTLEKFIESHKDDLRSLESDRLLQYYYPVSDLEEDLLTFIPDKEISKEILINTISRLKIRVIDWHDELCNNCELCIPDCPTKCISYDEKTDKIVRDEKQCLRCSICYQSCPFSAIKYFLAKFSYELNEDNEEVISITVKNSVLTTHIEEANHDR